VDAAQMLGALRRVPSSATFRLSIERNGEAIEIVLKNAG